ncbi:TPA: O-antigen ligase family protein [Enterococcus faecium]|uniref:O-antigen ligase family protein n=1 Tax=Enterococcus faecium TaxID=1352 RepID=UPI00145A7A29|nr:O-antigen ligase family protein [Enterococcus faecium]NMO48159.1 O-antigen ligase family protein [Enterococcus faecium]HCR2871519.1 O-antigen ligase family protein [Enterococcus faecium]
MLVSKRTLIVFFLTIPIIMPDLTECISPSMALSLKTLKIVAILFAGIWYLLTVRSSKTTLALMSIFFVVYYWCTFRTQQDVNTVFNISINTIGACILTIVAIERGKIQGLTGMFLGYFSLILINLGTVIFIPQGLYQSHNHPMYFLEYDNNFIWFYIPAICLGEILCYCSNNKKWRIFLNLEIAICLFTVIYRWTAMGMVGMFLICVSRAVLRSNKTGFVKYTMGDARTVLTSIFNVRFIILALCVNLGIVFLRIQYIFSFIIVNILGKSLDLGRLNIWDKAMFYIAQSPIWGYGREFSWVVTQKLFWKETWFSVSHCHNIFLNVLYETGIIGLSVLLIYIIYTWIKLNPFKNYKSAHLLSCYAGIFIIVLTTETYQKMLGFFVVLTICTLVNSIENIKLDNNT